MELDLLSIHKYLQLTYWVHVLFNPLNDEQVFTH